MLVVLRSLRRLLSSVLLGLLVVLLGLSALRAPQSAETTQASRDTAPRKSAVTTDARVHLDRELLIGSLNMLNAMAHPRASKYVGGCDTAGDSAECIDRRSARQAAAITGAGSPRPRMAVVALSEVSPEQYAALLRHLPGYAHYPQQVSKNHGVALVWDTRQVTYVRGGTVKNVYNNVGDLDRPRFPWVQVRTEYGRKVDVLGVHSTSTRYPGHLRRQLHNTQVFRSWAGSFPREHTVLVGGDFNNSLADPGPARRSAESPYCAMDRRGRTQFGRDLVRGVRPGEGCAGSEATRVSLDQVWVAPRPTLAGTRWANLGPGKGKEGDSPTGTDHGPVLVGIAPRW